MGCVELAGDALKALFHNNHLLQPSHATSSSDNNNNNNNNNNSNNNNATSTTRIAANEEEGSHRSKGSHQSNHTAPSQISQSNLSALQVAETDTEEYALQKSIELNKEENEVVMGFLSLRGAKVPNQDPKGTSPPTRATLLVVSARALADVTAFGFGERINTPHPINPPYQHTRSIQPLNTTSQHTLSTHPINPPYQHALSTHSINPPYQHNLSTHPINPPYQHALSTHPINPPY